MNSWHNKQAREGGRERDRIRRESLGFGAVHICGSRIHGAWFWDCMDLGSMHVD